MKKASLLIMALLAVFTVSAQNQIKIGYTNAEYILSFLPEAKQIESELKDYQKQLSTQMDSKVQEFQTKMQTYEQTAENMIPEVRADKELELRNLQQSIQKFEQDAQTSLQKKQAELLQPAYDKIQKAIDAVAKANGYTHVLNSGQPEMGLFILLYAADEFNVSNLVLKHMGIEPPAEDASPGVGTKLEN